MPELVRTAGFDQVHTASYQPKFNTGEKKRYWEYTLYEVAQAMIRAGIITQAEFDSLKAGLERIGKDDSIIAAQAVQTQVSNSHYGVCTSMPPLRGDKERCFDRQEDIFCQLYTSQPPSKGES